MSMNKVLLIGNIGGTPRSGTTQTGHFWCNASLATQRKKKDTYETTWHKIVAWGKTAEILESCQKGDSIFLEGELNVHTYDKDRQKAKAKTSLATYAHADAPTQNL